MVIVEDIKASDAYLSTVEWKAIEAVLPEDMINKIHATDDSAWQLQWVLGDIVNEAYELVVASKMPYIRKIQVANYISGEMREAYSPFTLLDYSTIAARYPSAIRSEFDRLPYSHFVYAAQDGGERKLTARQVLEMSLDLANQNHGRPISLRKLRDAVEGMRYDVFQGQAPGDQPVAGITTPAVSAGHQPRPPASTNPLIEIDNALQVIINALPQVQALNPQLAKAIAAITQDIKLILRKIAQLAMAAP